MKRILVLVVLAVVVALFSAARQANVTAVDDDDEIGLIVHTAKPYDGVIDMIESMGGTVNIEYDNADAIAITIDGEMVPEVASLKGVVTVEKDRIVNLPGGLGGLFQATTADMSGSQLLDPIETAALITQMPDTLFSYHALSTGAAGTWDDTDAGAASIVAVIDSGVADDGDCLDGRVIEGPDFSPDAGTPLEGSTSPDNWYHGTFVAGLIAANCFLLTSPDDILGEILTTHLPTDSYVIDGDNLIVPLQGTAPAASIYAVKVFPQSAFGVPSSIVEQALDHVITVHTSGELDIDVINMSVDGVSLDPGNTLEELLIDAATEAGITVVVAAGNDGPAPVSITSPGTAETALTVGAAVDPVHARIFLDSVLGFGEGIALYPENEIRPMFFSGRGPTADSREGLNLLATGAHTFSLFTPVWCGPFEIPRDSFCVGWDSGTSYSTPTVSGAAALLHSWAETNDPSQDDPIIVRNALIQGATSIGKDWDEVDQGGGYLNVAESLDLLKDGDLKGKLKKDKEKLKANLKFKKGEATKKIKKLGPSRKVDLIFEIKDTTDQVIIEIQKVKIDDRPVPAFFENTMRVYVKSAKGGGMEYLVYCADVYDDATIIINDGFTDLSGAIIPEYTNDWPMEPGLMKVTVEGNWNNAGNVEAKVTVRRSDDKEKTKSDKHKIVDGGFDFVEIEIPEGTDIAVFELRWKNNWSRPTTNDLDVFLFDPNFDFYPDFSGFTFNSPEQIIVPSPMPGIWTVGVDAFQVFTDKEHYYIDVRLTPPPDDDKKGKKKEKDDD